MQTKDKIINHFLDISGLLKPTLRQLYKDNYQNISATIGKHSNKHPLVSLKYLTRRYQVTAFNSISRRDNNGNSQYIFID